MRSYRGEYCYEIIKLHQKGREVLVNLSSVSEIYPEVWSDKSILHLNFAINNEQVRIRVDESMDEILYLSERSRSEHTSHGEAKPLTTEAPDYKVSVC